ncbi:MAG: glycoside hydrolase family 99-like domain-containing protein [Saprospiraceae bacterium]|nr:glycoside hydrolase family 99-like domain-containing protein [Saprospiraceae bacterium]
MKTRVIAFYLPQFHPIPENDEWWGKGFTEWTNVGRAKKLFKGHNQPRVPADLGYYDLRVPETRTQQAEMARQAGIEGFVYWHYWFAGKRLLERPFNEVLETGDPNLPFCLAWANETWTGAWNNEPKRILIEQTYPGGEDYTNHFNANLKAFKDSRYIRINDCPVFFVYKPLNIPDPDEFISTWNLLASRNGINKFYFIGITSHPKKETDQIRNYGFDAVNVNRLLEVQSKISFIKYFYRGVSRRLLGARTILNILDYSEVIKHWVCEDDYREDVIPTAMPNWDTSPRSGRRAIIVTGSTPKLFGDHLSSIVNVVRHKKNRVILLKSWNEWAEGNYVEPDMRYGSGYLNILEDVLRKERNR